jgi:hypothetical protein
MIIIMTIIVTVLEGWMMEMPPDRSHASTAHDNVGKKPTSFVGGCSHVNGKIRFFFAVMS